MNAYFQVCTGNGKPVLRFYPPTEGGEGIRREEVLEYLNQKKILINYNEFAPLLEKIDKVTDISVSLSSDYLEGETVYVSVSPDYMTATVRIIAPFEGGPQMPVEEFMRELTARGVVYGIETDTIETLLYERVYCTDVVVATGLEPNQGKDAMIDYFFNTDPKVRPTLNEDGSVDFFHLNTVNNCKKGDILARLSPAVKGKPGTDVMGREIKPRDIKALALRFGRNISANDTKTEIYSEVDGHVTLVDGTVFVSNVLEVENVDNSIGNIDYDGDVKVNGRVCENFTVKAGGSVIVNGVVEGANIEAGGNIIIARGMNGMHKGVLHAGGNIIAKFLENSTASANGYIETESIIHSRVIAGTEIHVNGKRGFITGGKVSASTLIEVKNLGSEMGSDTIVEVGMDVSAKQEALNLQKEIAEINKQQATIVPVLEGAKQKLAQGIRFSSDQAQRIQQLALINKKNTDRLAVCTAKLEEYKDILQNGTGGQVIVIGEVYPGTKICIGDVATVVKKGMKYCRFIKEAGEVKMAAIY